MSRASKKARNSDSGLYCVEITPPHPKGAGYLAPYANMSAALSYKGGKIKVAGVRLEVPKRSADGLHHFANYITGAPCTVARDDVAAAVEFLLGAMAMGIIDRNPSCRTMLDFVAEHDNAAFLTLFD